jgi:hypothetical protein
MVGASQIAPLVKKLTKGVDRIDFAVLVRQIYGQFPNDLRPIQTAIVECELVENGFRRRPGGTMFERG